MTTRHSRPASNPAATRAGRQRAQALHALQQQQSQPSPDEQKDDLLQQIEEHLLQQEQTRRTADLIDALIEKYPDCPKFVSHLVDRLLANDQALAEALRSEDIY